MRSPKEIAAYKEGAYIGFLIGVVFGGQFIMACYLLR
jgi:hypothetical protein